MFYEISREIFKQRVEKPLNFAIIDLTQGGSGLPSTSQMVYSEDFMNEFSKSHADKGQSILLFSLDMDDHSPKVAGKKLSESGYQAVYYYHGNKNKDSLIGKR